MLAPLLAPWLARRGIHYGWVVVGVTFLTMLTMAGAVGLPSALIKPLGQEFHWDVGGISGALALRLVLFGVMGLFSAALIDRHGVRRVIVLAVTLVALGFVAALRVTALWQLVLFWGVMVGVGTGLTALVLGALTANRWFVRHRGLVVGVLTASSATGQLAFLPVAAWLVEHVGWRLAIIPVLIASAVVVALVALLLCDRPSDVGLLPYGADTAPPQPMRPGGSALATALRTISEAGRTPTFWILFGTFFICGLSTNGLIQTHFISLCGDFGMGEVQAAGVLAMMGGFDVVGTILSGWLSDRLDNRYLLFWYYGLRGLSLLYLPHSTFTIQGLTLFATFYGLDWVATVPPTVRLAGAAYGRERAGLVFGWVFAAHQIGAATAALAGGLSRTALLTYVPAFYSAGAACLIAAGAVLLIPRQGGAPTGILRPAAA